MTTPRHNWDTGKITSPRRLTLSLALAVCCWLTPVALCAQPAPSSQTPIPDAATLLKEVVAHQRQMDSVRENYTYREVTVTRLLNKHGKVLKTTTETNDVFFVNTHEVDRLIAKNGHPLTPGEERKEQDRVNKAIALAEKTPPGQVPDHNTVSISKLLSIMQLTSPRRIQMDGRSTLVFHFTGNRHAHTRGLAENASKKLAGTLWIDEQDRDVRRLEAHFDANFRMGWGLASVAKGSTFIFEQRRVQGALWLPASAHINLLAHAIGFLTYRADIQISDSGYHVFHVSTQQAAQATAAASGSQQR
jgi:hypothetical protein